MSEFRFGTSDGNSINGQVGQPDEGRNGKLD